MRQCPTLEGEGTPLITHMIVVDDCLSRQRGFYHKCHRCVYRGKPVGYEAPAEKLPAAIIRLEPEARNGTAETSTPSKPAEIPRGAPAVKDREPARKVPIRAARGE